eukprot:440155-Prymnesium_polylepis.1
MKYNYEAIIRAWAHSGACGASSAGARARAARASRRAATAAPPPRTAPAKKGGRCLRVMKREPRGWKADGLQLRGWKAGGRYLGVNNAWVTLEGEGRQQQQT